MGVEATSLTNRDKGLPDKRKTNMQTFRGRIK